MPVTLGNAINAIHNGQFYGDMEHLNARQQEAWKEQLIACLKDNIQGDDDTHLSATALDQIAMQIGELRKHIIQTNQGLGSISQAHDGATVMEAMQLQFMKMADDIRPKNDGSSDNAFDGFAWKKMGDDSYERCTILAGADWGYNQNNQLISEPKVPYPSKDGITLADAIAAIQRGQFYGDSPKAINVNNLKNDLINCLKHYLEGDETYPVNAKTLDAIATKLENDPPNHLNLSKVSRLALQFRKMAADIRPNARGESDNAFNGIAWVKISEPQDVAIPTLKKVVPETPPNVFGKFDHTFDDVVPTKPNEEDKAVYARGAILPGFSSFPLKENHIVIDAINFDCGDQKNCSDSSD